MVRKPAAGQMAVSFASIWNRCRRGCWRRYCGIVLGNLLITSAYAFITVPLGIVNGGTTSFAMILSAVTGWNIKWIVNATTLLLLALCRVFLGRTYLAGALVSGICYTGLFSALESLQRVFPLPLVLGTPLAALLVGTGYALCIHAHSTALGFDTVALILHEKHKRLNISCMMFFINTLTLLLGFTVYGGKAIVCGVAFTCIQARVLHLLLHRLEGSDSPTST